MISNQEFLLKFPFFKKESSEFISDFLDEARIVSFPAKTILLEEREFCQSMEFIISGEKRVYKASETGREITLYEVGPGEVCLINASCIMANAPSPVHAISSTPMKSLLLSGSKFRHLMAKYEIMREFIFSAFSQVFAPVVCLLEEVAFRKLDERLAEYLVEKSEDNELYTTHQQIADDLGTAREVISRLLKDFERKGLIVLSRKYIRIENL